MLLLLLAAAGTTGRCITFCSVHSWSHALVLYTHAEKNKGKRFFFCMEYKKTTPPPPPQHTKKAIIKAATKQVHGSGRGVWVSKILQRAALCLTAERIQQPSRPIPKPMLLLLLSAKVKKNELYPQRKLLHTPNVLKNHDPFCLTRLSKDVRIWLLRVILRPVSKNICERQDQHDQNTHKTTSGKEEFTIILGHPHDET